MAIIVGDTVRIDQGFRVDGVNAAISAHYELENAGTATDDLDLLNSLILDNWNPTFISGVWNSANATGVLATCLKVGKVLPIEEPRFVYIQNVPGVIITDWLPSHAAAMITKTGKTGGPGSSGRNFLPAPPEVHFTNGRLNSAGAILWNSVASFFNDVLSLGAFGTQWAPQHVQAGGVHTDVFRAWVNPNIRTIRSRQAVDCAV